MKRFIAGGVVGLVLGSAATAGAVATRVIQLRSGDVAPVQGTYIYCKVGPQPTGTGVVCNEVKKGIEASYGVGITNESVYVVRFKGSHGEKSAIVFSRLQHSG